MTARHITYGLDADAYLVARAVDSALSGLGCRVQVDPPGDGAKVWIFGRNEPDTEAVQFEPGQRLIVCYDRTWRIEPAPAWAVAS